MPTHYPHAIQKPIVRNFGGRRAKTRAVVLHVDAGGAASLQGWFNNPASSASSHFYVKYDGTVEQYVDADLIAWTQRAGNTTCIGIETQGLGDGDWTAAQLASINALVRWLCDHYGLPKADMVTSAPAARGIGMHRYGIDPYRVAAGEVWGPRAKACPGQKRVGQFPGVVAGVNGGTVTPPGVPPTGGGAGETEAQLIARMNAGYSQAWIKAIQEKLNRLGHKLDTDGVRGNATIAAVKDFQGKNGLVPDGLPGVETNAKLDAALAPAGKQYDVIALQRAVRANPDSIWGADTDKRFDTLRSATTYHGYTFPYGKAFAQEVVGARADGVWGKGSALAHDNTVKAVQRVLGVDPDGIWGKDSEAAYLAARTQAGRK